MDSDKLEVVVQDNKDNFRRVRFTFDYVPIYRNIDELYRSSESINNTNSWTVVIDESKWLKELKEKEDLIEEFLPEIKHYQIITEFDVIDILSTKEPLVEEIESGKNIIGEAPVLYLPEDKLEVDKYFRKYKKPTNE